MENYEPWSQSEITQYQEMKSDSWIVNSLYREEKVPVASPDKRAELIAGKLELTAADHEVIIGIANKKGRPEALVAMEDIYHINLS